MVSGKSKIGIIGLGAMGREIALKLLAASCEVTVWNRSPEPVDELVNAGAIAADDPQQVFASEIVLTTLFGDDAIRSVLLENERLIGAAADTVHVCMSTVSVQLSEELTCRHQKAGVAYVSAPMFGRPEAAKTGQLNILLAGPQEATNKVEPVLNVLGKAWQLGTEPSHAHLAKIAGNAMIIGAWETMAEVAAVLNGHGADAEQFMSIMGKTLFSAPIYQAYGPAIAAGDGLDAAALPIAVKDNRLMGEAAEIAQVPAPLTELIQGLLREASGANNDER